MDTTIKHIVEMWLAAHGYDGLYRPGWDCGCRLGDLMPCDEPGVSCEAGVLLEDEDDPPSGHEFLIGPK